MITRILLLSNVWALMLILESNHIKMASNISKTVLTQFTDLISNAVSSKVSITQYEYCIPFVNIFIYRFRVRYMPCWNYQLSSLLIHVPNSLSWLKIIISTFYHLFEVWVCEFSKISCKLYISIVICCT